MINDAPTLVAGQALCRIATSVPGSCLWWAAGILVPSDEQVRHAVEKVYARPEFSPSPNWFNLFLEHLARYFRWLGELSSTNPVLFWILLLACIILLILLAAHIGWTIRRVFGSSASLADAEAASRQRERLSSHYWEEALRRAQESTFTEAIRCLFLSLVYRFDESGRVNFLRAYTNREYLSLFADRPEIHSALGLFVDTLDDCWYGQRPTDQGRYQECLALYEGLR
jgi:hypothetical protein